MALKIPVLPITRSQLNNIFAVILLINSIVAVGSVFVFFLSSWWVFLLMGTLGLPVLALIFLLYRFTTLKEPIEKYVINFIPNLYHKISKKREGLMRRIYTTVCWFLPTEEWKNIEWGYASMSNKGETIPLESTLEDKRYICQLYNYLVTGFGNWETLEGKKVLELQSKGGGGLNFIAETLHPKTCVGLDTSSANTEFCRKAFQPNSKLKFYTVSSLENFSKALELESERIDVAISVQSLKDIKDLKQFIQEVEEILRPGGVFALTDLRRFEEWSQLEKDLTTSSLKILKKENISVNVAQAIKLDEKGRWILIYRRIGSLVRKALKKVGLVRENQKLETLRKGEESAMAYLLHKLPQNPIQV